MAHEKFDVTRLEHLNDETRFEMLDPAVLWDALALPDPSVIVDLGAGTGLYSAAFAAMAPSAVVYAVDMEPVMVDWIRAHKPEVLRGVLIPLLSGETTVPLSAGSADAVVMLNLHHELERPEATYVEAARLLRQGGRILVADWSPDADQERPPKHVRVTPARLAEALSGAGFVNVTLHPSLPRHSLVTADRR